MAKNKETLRKLLSENPDPSKWTPVLKAFIALLIALFGALVEHSTDVVGTALNAIF